MLFKNREARIRFVKTNETNSENDNIIKPYQDPEVVKDFIKSTVVVIVLGIIVALTWKALLETIIRTVPDRR